MSTTAQTPSGLLRHAGHNEAVSIVDRVSSCILTVNGGSSSIRFAVYEAGETLQRSLAEKIDRIGLSGTNLVVSAPAGANVPRRLAAADHRTAVRFLLDWLEAQPIFAPVRAVGHRAVHGMRRSELERVTPTLVAELRRLTPFDPDQLLREIGEHAPLIRERICDGLGFLGIELHPTRNAENAPVISSDDGRVTVRVIRTDEDLMIATLVARVFNLGSIGKA